MVFETAFDQDQLLKYLTDFCLIIWLRNVNFPHTPAFENVLSIAPSKSHLDCPLGRHIAP